MPVVRMDEKGRIQLPSEIRKQWHLRPRQPLLVSVERGKVSVTRLARPTPETDPLRRDIIKRPLRSKRKVTRELLEKIEDEMFG